MQKQRPEYSGCADWMREHTSMALLTTTWKAFHSAFVSSLWANFITNRHQLYAFEELPSHCDGWYDVQWIANRGDSVLSACRQPKSDQTLIPAAEYSSTCKLTVYSGQYDIQVACSTRRFKNDLHPVSWCSQVDKLYSNTSCLWKLNGLVNLF